MIANIDDIDKANGDPVGAAEGCDLLILPFKNNIKRSQPAAALTGPVAGRKIREQPKTLVGAVECNETAIFLSQRSFKEDQLTHHGSCLCKAVNYELLTAPKAVSHCHCSQCRKGHGAAFASYGSVPRSALRLLSGAEAITAYSSSDSVLREFCGRCGSSLFWSRCEGEFADWISIALGTLDTSFASQKQQHIHLDSKASWFDHG